MQVAAALMLMRVDASAEAAIRRPGIGCTGHPVRRALRPPKPLGFSFPAAAPPQFLSMPRLLAQCWLRVELKGGRASGRGPFLAFFGATVD